MLPAVFGERAGGLPRRLLAAAPLAWLGVVSYGLFLWHLPVAQFLALRDGSRAFLGLGPRPAPRDPTATTPILLS